MILLWDSLATSLLCRVPANCVMLRQECFLLDGGTLRQLGVGTWDVSYVTMVAYERHVHAPSVSVIFLLRIFSCGCGFDPS